MTSSGCLCEYSEQNRIGRWYKLLGAEYILTLLKIPKIGRKTVAAIISYLNHEPQNLSDLRDGVANISQHLPRLMVPDSTSIQAANQKALEIVEKSYVEGIDIIPFGSGKYPKKLMNIADPPVILFTKGNKNCLNHDKNIAIIGTREPTIYGKKCGEAISSHFVDNGFVVTSGLAKGCDEAAHRGAVKVSGTTIAILGHGLHMIYPAKNRALANEIVESGGCLLSEYETGVNPKPNFFIERDRLQSGLALGVFVIETRIKSGTMHAVNSCIADGKPLACLHHPERFISDPNIQGNKLLISEKGAHSISEKADVDRFVRVLINQNDKHISHTENRDGHEQLLLFG